MVEAVRELRRANRAEPVVELELLGLADADPAQQPPERARSQRLVERVVHERPGAELAPRGLRLAAEADQLDRPCDRLAGRDRDRLLGLVARLAADVDTSHGRARGDRAPLRERDATDRGGTGGEHRDHRAADDEQAPATARRAGGGRDEEVGHFAGR